MSVAKHFPAFAILLLAMLALTAASSSGDVYAYYYYGSETCTDASSSSIDKEESMNKAGVCFQDKNAGFVYNLYSLNDDKLTVCSYSDSGCKQQAPASCATYNIDHCTNISQALTPKSVIFSVAKNASAAASTVEFFAVVLFIIFGTFMATY